MAEISEEDLANMSPEQLREMQKKNCIFCHIISGRVSSKKVYEDERCMGILDINPCNPGHLLLLPKDHYAVMPQIPEDLVEHMFIIAKGLSNALLKSLQVGGTNIFLANGVSAGQKAPHFMIHIVPRKEGDGITNFNLPASKLDETSVLEAEKKVKAKLNSLLGLSSQETINMDSERVDSLSALPFEEDVHSEPDNQAMAGSHERSLQSQEDTEDQDDLSEDEADDEDVSVEKKLGLSSADNADDQGNNSDGESEDDEDVKNDVDLDDISSVLLGGGK